MVESGAMLPRTDTYDRETVQRLFLDAYVRRGSITGACDTLGINRDTVYGWLEREGYGPDGEHAPEGSFAHAFRRAKHAASETLIGALHQRAMDSESGMPGAVSAMFLIKAQRPEYRDQLNIKSTSVNLTARVDLDALDEPAKRFLLARLTEQLALGDAPPQPQLGEGAPTDDVTDAP